MTNPDFEIAITGISCRVPGANDLEGFWKNLVAGRESITFFSDSDLLAAGVDKNDLHATNYVKARAVLEEADLFDAQFFGYTPREAALIDPQHRILLECAWQALESAGYDSERISGAVGVFVGSSPSTYLLHGLGTDSIRALESLLGTDRDFLASRISYKLNLEGPSLTIQTACSTSLVAVHQACLSLIAGECAVALAGGSSINFPQQSGYQFEPGGILSPDGHCRPFDDRAQGTIRGSGAGIVALRRLSEAQDDGDHIYAVIKGSAINNDGGRKVGFTAPRAQAQAKVIKSALAIAGIDGTSIHYVETHGTGTPLGDPIELTALASSLGPRTLPQSRCAIGSVKSNIGHLDAAAGIVGLIKTTLSVQRGQIPPSLNFSTPNRNFDLSGSPLYVNTSLRKWPESALPRRAGVSSFGMGGTNAHVILEQSPPGLDSTLSRHLFSHLMLSAKEPTALAAMANNLADFLEAAHPTNLSDVAFTLQTGRREFRHRLVVTCSSPQQAVYALRGAATNVGRAASESILDPLIVFMFPGQGVQRINMARDLFDRNAIFREAANRCFDLLGAKLDCDLRAIIFPTEEERASVAGKLDETMYAQAAIFSIEYALAETWIELGLVPRVLFGHSIGEYAAACLAGIMTLEDAAILVAERAKSMQACPRGEMVVISGAPESISDILPEGISIAALNAPQLTVVGGDTVAVEALCEALKTLHVPHHSLSTSHAFHTPMMDSALPRFEQAVKSVKLRSPQIPVVSSVTGSWLTDEQAVDPEYWTTQIRKPVMFSAGLEHILSDPQTLLLEVGPGETLSILARQQRARPSQSRVISSLGNRNATEQEDCRALAEAAAKCWACGASFDWTKYYQGERRRRLILPTYPFKRLRYWIGETAATDQPTISQSSSSGQYNRPDLNVSYVEPTNELERALRDIWTKVFGYKEIGIHDDFFDLGGHSLLAIQLIFLVRDELKLQLELGALLKNSTIAKLALQLASDGTSFETSAKSASFPVLEIDTYSHDAPFQLSDLQHAYWIGRLDLLGLGNRGSHYYVEFDCDALDLARFGAALSHVIARHDMLRAIIDSDGRQRVLSQVPTYSLRYEDLHHSQLVDKEIRLKQIRKEMVDTILPSDTWPLFDVRASRISDRKIRLHFKIDFLVADAQSVEIVFADLATFYEASNAKPPNLEISYRDYISALSNFENSDRFRRAETYWKQRIEKLPPSPRLPLAKTPTGGSLNRRRGTLDRAAWSALKSRSSVKGLTPSALVCAAYCEILALWSEEPHFTLTLTLFNRLPLHTQVDQVVGDFTSTTLLEVNVVGGTFAERAARLQRQLWADIDHQYFSGIRVLRELNKTRFGMNHRLMPYIFTSLLTMPQQNESRFAELVSGSAGFSSSQSPQILIDHQVAEEDGSLVYVWDVLEEAFPAGMIDEMWDTFGSMLRILAADVLGWERPGSPVLRPQSLAAPSASPQNSRVWSHAMLHTLFLDQAEAQPDAIAIQSSAGTKCYREVAGLSLQVAARLQCSGVRRSDVVALIAEKGWEQVVGALGILRAGGAYLPVDPSEPPERLRAILQDSEVTYVLTQKKLSVHLGELEGIDVLYFDDLEDWTQTSDLRELNQTPADLAYVIYTSGSSGVPKGVAIEHRGAVNTILDISERFGICNTDRVLALSNLSFDLSVFDIFGTLAAGGTIVVPNLEWCREPLELIRLIKHEHVTVWNSVPALLQMMADTVSSIADSSLSSLRLVLLSGDWIPLNLPSRVRELAPSARVVSLGGATEASIWSIFFPVETVDSNWRSIPYGRALAGQSCRVLNFNLEPCPTWVPGMIYIGGAGVARGYWNNPSATLASFIQHPQTSERLYRTGDMGRLLPDGNIELLGRLDEQVKIGGYRIELGEIEKAILKFPGVRAAVVAPKKDLQEQASLVAYVVVTDVDRPCANSNRHRHCSTAMRHLDLPSLRDFLRARLPSYMIPNRILELPTLPLSRNGKVDRNALPAPLANADKEMAPVELPQTPTERRLAEIWEETLGRRGIGTSERFFELGGNSFSAARIAARVSSVFSTQVPLRVLFENPTVKELASTIDNLVLKPVRPPKQLQSSQGHSQLPLSFDQESIWFMQQTAPNSAVFVMPAVVELSGAIDHEKLEACVGRIVDRHEPLRTSFTVTGGRPYQRIKPVEEIRVSYVDLRSLTPEKREEQFRSHVSYETSTPFDLEKGPLLRLKLLHKEADRYTLLFSIHHLIADEWSIRLFLEELSILYAADCSLDSAISRLPPLPLSFADFVRWQRSIVNDLGCAPAVGYWRRQLADLPILELPSDRERAIAGNYAGASCDFELSEHVSEALRQLGREAKVTLFGVLLSAFNVFLHLYTGKHDVAIGSNFTGRSKAGIENLIGFFVNTVVLRNNIRSDVSFFELLDQVWATVLDAHSNSMVPFQELVKQLQFERQPDRAPLFQIMFVLQEEASYPIAGDSWTVDSLEVISTGSKYDVTLYMQDAGAAIIGSFEYNKNMFDPDSMEFLCDRFKDVLRLVSQAPNSTIDQLLTGVQSEKKSEFYS